MTPTKDSQQLYSIECSPPAYQEYLIKLKQNDNKSKLATTNIYYWLVCGLLFLLCLHTGINGFLGTKSSVVTFLQHWPTVDIHRRTLHGRSCEDNVQRLDRKCRSSGLWSFQMEEDLQSLPSLRGNTSSQVCSVVILPDYREYSENYHQTFKSVLFVRHPMLLIADLYLDVVRKRGTSFSDYVHDIVSRDIPSDIRQLQICQPCSVHYEELVKLEQSDYATKYARAWNSYRSLFASLNRITRAKLVSMVAQEMAMFGYTWDLETSAAGCKMYKDKLGRACC